MSQIEKELPNTASLDNSSSLQVRKPLQYYFASISLWLVVSIGLALLLGWLFSNKANTEIEINSIELSPQAVPIIANFPQSNVMNCEKSVEQLLKKERIHFATASAHIYPKGLNLIKNILVEIKKCPVSTIKIVGHTDNTGSSHFNMLLSQQRAEAVAKVMRASELKQFKIITVGLGASKPIASNKTSKGRYQNRRIEILLQE